MVNLEVVVLEDYVRLMHPRVVAAGGVADAVLIVAMPACNPNWTEPSATLHLRVPLAFGNLGVVRVLTLATSPRGYSGYSL